MYKGINVRYPQKCEDCKMDLFGSFGVLREELDKPKKLMCNKCYENEVRFDNLGATPNSRSNIHETL